MKSALTVLIVLLTLFLMGFGIGGGEGRYEAVSSPIGQTVSICIIDTTEGHLWLHAMGHTIYMGKVRPGEKPGEVVTKISLKEKREE